MEHGPGPLVAVESSPLAVAMRQDLWLYPIVEIFHIAGFTVLVGSIVVLDLRLLGLSRTLSVRDLSRHILPWTFAALLLIVPTGLLMFMAHASDLISNRAFQLKLGLIALAGVNAALFHTGAGRNQSQWEREAAPSLAVRMHAVVSLIIWGSVIACGRLLAYL